MPEVNIIIKCGICGTEKKETNHWWILEYRLERKSTFSYPFELYDGNTYSNLADGLFICGLECLLLAESRIRNGRDPK